MRLSISNIGWEEKEDEIVYSLMKKHGYVGLEIAPTRIFPQTPYEKIDEAKAWSYGLKSKYGFDIPSMQSIWYGKSEMLFGTEEERKTLLDYTKKAIDFAASINCKNLVFGCPRNRNMPEGADAHTAIAFFKELGDYAITKGTVIGMEANPTIYGTNYINDTPSALNLVRCVNSKGFLLNLDVGTMIQNEESVSEIVNNVHLINHIHISEPNLKKIEKRQLHQELNLILQDEKYDRFISIEMGKTNDINNIEECLQYIKGVFQ